MPRTLLPGLTTSASNGPWAARRGKFLTLQETARYQGICLRDWAWASDQKWIRFALGNTICAPLAARIIHGIVPMILGEIVVLATLPLACPMPFKD